MNDQQDEGRIAPDPFEKAAFEKGGFEKDAPFRQNSFGTGLEKNYDADNMDTSALTGDEEQFNEALRSKGRTLLEESGFISDRFFEQPPMPEVVKASPQKKDTNPKDGAGSLKPNYSAVPIPVLYELGAALIEGARKYGGYNWRVAGVRTSVYIDAARRHIDSFWEGEDIDPDSGLSHVTKAIASLVVFRDAMIQDKVDNDDRPPSTQAPFMAEGQERMADLQRRYPNPVAGFTQAEVQHLRNTPVSIYPGQTLGFELEVMLPADDAPEGFVWMQQGPRRTDLDLTLAIAQTLREEGYGKRVIRITRVADRMEAMANGDEYVSGEMRMHITTVFPGDASLTEEDSGEEDS